MVLDPEMERLLPDVQGKRVLDVGCGEGRFCRLLAARGASTVGIDPVEAFITQARNLHPEGEYHTGFAEALPFEDGSFDIVLSYLTLIDIPGFDEAVAEMVRVLRRGGRLVIATIANYQCTEEAWVRGPNGEKLHRPLDKYMEERAMVFSWSGITVQNWHRPLSRVLGEFLKHGLTLKYFGEPLCPESDPDYVNFRRAPFFQTMVWEKS
ncbi:MAG: class I SAM-dependent methyltransferase [Armatimonadetes bacterium]|nr:class I SAM-dependent methyltransferase [Armatimonadota bacterium]